jgi:drug/metabolite transporter (DMT)-like permease
MSPSWIAIALASTSIAALVNTLDSHFLSRRMPGLRSYLLIIGLFCAMVAIIMLLINPFPHGTGLRIYGMAFISAMLRVGAVSCLMYAMKKEDISRIMPLTATAPIFVAIMAAMFLGESLRYTQWLAICVVVSGAVLISFKRGNDGSAKFHASSFFLLIGSSLLYATSDVFNKYTMDYISYWNSASLSFLFTSMAFIVLCLRRDVLRQIAGIARPCRTSAAVVLNQIAAMFSTVLGFWAIQNGPVSLASTIFNSKPLFVFVYAILLARLMPGFLLESWTDRKGLILKIIATLMIVGGIALIFLL